MVQSHGYMGGDLEDIKFMRYNKKHGMSNTRFYNNWRGMINRCHNKNYSIYYKYGKKGIKVCDRWLKFENFRDDMYKNYLKHCKKFGIKQTTIDRINTNSNYAPENCRWATNKEQSRNKSNNKYFTYNGKTMILKDWSDKLKINYATLRSRIYKYKWLPERAFKND